VTRGLKEGGTVILNDTIKPSELDIGLPLGTVATLVNTILMGAIAKATDWVKLENLFEPIMHAFPGRIGELNVEACKKGYAVAEVA